MKTLVLNGTTKQSNSVSGYFARVAMFLMRGEKQYMKLRTRMDIPRILNMVHDVETIVFVMPTYCDTVPSNVLYFLEELEKYCRETHRHFHIYAIVSCGFIEGKQTEPVLRVMENFCARSQSIWEGGIGIGGGTMLNVSKFCLFIWTIATVILCVYGGLRFGDWLPGDAVVGYLQTVFVVAFFNIPALTWIVWLVHSINNGKFHKIRYVRPMIPAWLFAVCADVGFFVLSVIGGGFFKGLNRKL